MTTVQPTDDRLFVKVDDPESVTSSGIILPGVAQDRPTEGTVLATGPNVSDALAEGDRILFTKYGGYLAEVDGEERVFLRETDVLAKLQPDA